MSRDGRDKGTKARRRRDELPHYRLVGMVVVCALLGTDSTRFPLTALGFLYLALSVSHSGVPIFDQWLENAVVAVCFSVVGDIITPRLPPKNPIGWFFCAIGLVGGARLYSAQYAAYTLSAERSSQLGGEALSWIASWLWVLHVGLFVFLALLFPDGKLASGRWRPFAWFAAAAIVAGILAVAFSHEPIRGIESIDNPLGIEGAPDLVVVLEALMFGLGFGAAASMFARLRRARGVERQQLKWFAYAAAVLAGGTILTNVVSNAMGVGWLREVGFLPTTVGLVGWRVPGKSIGNHRSVCHRRNHRWSIVGNGTRIPGESQVGRRAKSESQMNYKAA